ncbi:FABP family protein [uncultured Schumannella sp.]|jgi:hypothetical protein|uniref:FABP family protein n=1 Tax=uncultured Schumannella sp. TaxID=1195956 RepID=UPI0025D75FC9|nr:FABP family protein [uncultured Schumannella sp.]
MFELDPAVPAELVPLSWLIGVWEGTGVLAYRAGDQMHEGEFGQRVAFSHDGGRHLQYSCTVWALDAEAEASEALPYFSELGYWSLARPATAADAGPGMIPGVGESDFTTAEQVETLRNAAGSFDIEVSILHAAGVSELYLGAVAGPRIDLATDAVVRTASAKDYSAATRIYGLVEDHLLWAWDIAALGHDLRTHASGRLARVD